MFGQIQNMESLTQRFPFKSEALTLLLIRMWHCSCCLSVCLSDQLTIARTDQQPFLPSLAACSLWRSLGPRTRTTPSRFWQYLVSLRRKLQVAAGRARAPKVTPPQTEFLMKIKDVRQSISDILHALLLHLLKTFQKSYMPFIQYCLSSFHASSGGRCVL